MRLSWKISIYLIRSVFPYFVFSWVLLSVILFVQQAGRFSDIFFSANVPSSLIWQLSIALIPNVVSFTCPMAALVGVIIGLTKMQNDSEIVAIKAAGVGNFAIAIPFLMLGVVLSLFAVFVNLRGVPAAAGIVRQVALRSALHKLESPIEPGVFNTEIAGFTIYVKGGDIETGKWKNIFVHNEDPASGTVRLITSRSGRIDHSEDDSELVLENAVSSTITRSDGNFKYFSENIGEVRYAVKTSRSDLVQRINSTDLSPEELGLDQLSDYAKTREGPQRTEAELLWYRRILLSASPLIFCIFATVFVLRYNRKSRGFAIASALLALIAYYLLAFLGEQLARTGSISVPAGSLIPVLFSIFAIVWLAAAGRFAFAGRVGDAISSAVNRLRTRKRKTSLSNVFLDMTSGLRDFDIAIDLLRYYLLSLFFLTAVFMIFTAFELWKFAGTMDNGIYLLIKYLFFLLPFIYLQLSASAAMIATLATYVIKSRQNEIVTWTSAGQSVYRLLLPCLLFTILLGFINWQVQERIAPLSNRIQDDLRLQIRSRGILPVLPDKIWVADDAKVISFKLGNGTSNTSRLTGQRCTERCDIVDLTVYSYGDDGVRLRSVYRAPTAIWERGRVTVSEEGDRLDLGDESVTRASLPIGTVIEGANPFLGLARKPAQMNTEEVRLQLEASESEIEKRNFAVALERKYATPFQPLVMALLTAPFALSLSRKGKAATTGFAIGIWLVYIGTISVFDQLGLIGSLPPTIAVWAPTAAFAALGTFLLTRVRT